MLKDKKVINFLDKTKQRELEIWTFKFKKFSYTVSYSLVVYLYIIINIETFLKKKIHFLLVLARKPRLTITTRRSTLQELLQIS